MMFSKILLGYPDGCERESIQRRGRNMEQSGTCSYMHVVIGDKDE